MWEVVDLSKRRQTTFPLGELLCEGTFIVRVLLLSECCIHSIVNNWRQNLIWLPLATKIDYLQVWEWKILADWRWEWIMIEELQNIMIVEFMGVWFIHCAWTRTSFHAHTKQSRLENIFRSIIFYAKWCSTIKNECTNRLQAWT